MLVKHPFCAYVNYSLYVQNDLFDLLWQCLFDVLIKMSGYLLMKSRPSIAFSIGSGVTYGFIVYLFSLSCILKLGIFSRHLILLLDAHRMIMPSSAEFMQIFFPTWLPLSSVMSAPVSMSAVIFFPPILMVILKGCGN